MPEQHQESYTDNQAGDSRKPVVASVGGAALVHYVMIYNGPGPSITLIRRQRNGIERVRSRWGFTNLLVWSLHGSGRRAAGHPPTVAMRAAFLAYQPFPGPLFTL
jgi:hypothetical protein